MADGREAPGHEPSRLLVLSTLNRRLNSALGAREVIRLGARLMGELLGLSGVALYVVRTDGGGLELAYADAAVAACYEGAEQLAVEEGIAGQTLATGAPCSVSGRLLAGAARVEGGEGPQCEQLCVPVVSDHGEVLAVAHCHRAAGQALSAEACGLIQEAAADLGRALARARAFDDLREGVIHDELTGLYNRVYLREQIEHELQKQQRYGIAFSVAFLDIDHFKAVNDTYGHGVGDRVLRGVAARIRGALRGADIVCRYGGEEFVLLLPHTHGEEAVAAVDKVRAAIAEAGFAVGAGDGPIRVSATCGVASAPADAGSAEPLLEVADQRLYDGKLSGRNQVVGRGEAGASSDSRRRQAVRCTVALSATSAARRVLGLEVGQSSAEGPWRLCVVEDISRLGVRLQAPIASAPGAELAVRALLADERQGGWVAITVAARVVHTRPRADGGASIGLLFEGEARSRWREVYDAFHGA